MASRALQRRVAPRWYLTMQAPLWVVGGGTAGSTVLARLAASTTIPLVLAEPGGLSPHDDTPGFFDVLADPACLSTTEVSLVDGNDSYSLTQARVLGGGSAVNGMLLTGAVPPGLEGLTRMATQRDAGPIGRLLLERGGRLVRLWWNNGRWNPGRAAWHLVEEGRVTLVRAEVDALVIDDNTVTKVIVGGHEHEVSGVVLCAGAIATPLILLRSGAEKMPDGVGVGLQNHPEIAAEFHVVSDGPHEGFDACVVQETRSRGGRRLLTVAYERVPTREPGRGRVGTVLLDVVSRGSVTILGDRPTVRFHSLADDGDRDALCDGVRHLARLCVDLVRCGDITEPVIGAISAQDLVDMDDASLAPLLGEMVGLAAHPASSCVSIVGRSGAVRGVRGLWIADASALKSAPGCTPAAEVVMLARSVADAVGEVFR